MERTENSSNDEYFSNPRGSRTCTCIEPVGRVGTEFDQTVIITSQSVKDQFILPDVRIEDFNTCHIKTEPAITEDKFEMVFEDHGSSCHEGFVDIQQGQPNLEQGHVELCSSTSQVTTDRGIPTVSGTIKRLSLSMEVKLNILKELDKKKRTRSAIAKKYNLPNSTLATIIKNREKILKANNAGLALARTRMKEAKYPMLEKALFEWYKGNCQNNIHVQGVAVKATAEAIALQMNIPNFIASDGWFHRFKMRHGLSFKHSNVISPTSGTIKRLPLSIEVKLNILKEIDENRRTRSAIAKKYSLPNSTLATIVKNREKILRASHAGLSLARTRMIEARHPKMEIALLDWCKSSVQENIPVDGNIVKAKADEIALQMNINNFHSSDGWLQRFKVRHRLSLVGILYPRSVPVEKQADKLKRLLKYYNMEDVFNATETALFFDLLPDCTLNFKDETCCDGEQAKHRITIMLAANMSGTEKLPLLVIGKSKEPHCFEGIKTLPANYTSHEKSWMTDVIYEDWLRELDRIMSEKERKVLLFVDNCTTHKEVKDLRFITIEYLPPNTAAMYEGIIQTLKTNYRTMLLRRLLLNLENKTQYKIDLLGALHLLASSWNQVTQETISNGFRHAGFIKINTPATTSQADTISDDRTLDHLSEGNTVHNNETNNVNNELFENIRERISIPDSLDFTEYVNFDNNVKCSEELIIRRSIRKVQSSDRNSSAEEGSSENFQTLRPNLKQATDAIATLRCFFEKEENSEEFLNMIMDLENRVLKSDGHSSN